TGGLATSKGSNPNFLRRKEMKNRVALDAAYCRHNPGQAYVSSGYGCRLGRLCRDFFRRVSVWGNRGIDCARSKAVSDPGGRGYRVRSVVALRKLGRCISSDHTCVRFGSLYVGRISWAENRLESQAAGGITAVAGQSLAFR